MPLLRSNVEFTKRVFLDRLSTGDSSMALADPNNIDSGPGDPYVYANVGDSNNFGVGFDCSGWCSVGCAIAVNGPQFFAGTGYRRLFSTENFPGPLQGFRQVSQDDLVNNPYPLKVCIARRGGGENSHMNMQLDNIVMESNGTYGLCTNPDEITPVNSDYWNTWFVFDGPIVEDTAYRQAMTYPLGLDYSAGHIDGHDLSINGVKFVCRYVSDGGAGLPHKLLTIDEFQDLRRNKIAVVFNWETTANRMLDNTQGGIDDANAALDCVHYLGGPTNPVIYFSCDFDVQPDQYWLVENYCRGANQVLGGPQHTGIYGSYYICKHVRDAGVVGYLWQTAPGGWSDGNIDSRVNIVQRNDVGYQMVDGVQCDINEAHTDDFGQVR
jgi:hypothetical protein